MLWIEDQYDEPVIDAFTKQLKISEYLSKFLYLSGIHDPEDAKLFLKPKLAQLSDPFEIDGLVKAVERICKALDKKENILIVGDYDVDGITSTVIIKKFLAELDLLVSHITPRRKSEGYGLGMEVLNRGLKNRDITLVIALDCGTNSHDEALFLADKNIDLIIVDHHQAKEKVATEAIRVNPHLKEDKGEPWRYLCTAGLAFKLVHGVLKHLRIKGNEKAYLINPKDYIALSGLGTIADLVPLSGENRIIACFGLKFLGKTPEPGLNALLKEAKIDNQEIETEDVAFKVAPRINACGRLDRPEVAISLLLEKNHNKCQTLAKEMNRFNEERKGIESILSKEAIDQANKLFSELPAVIVCGEGEHWNPGVVGIVAGKLASSLGKPCIVLAKFGNEYKGSGRSIQGINLVDILSQCKEYLTHWGGHPAAIGLTINEDKIEFFKNQFIKVIQASTKGILPEPSLRIAVTIKKTDLTEKILNDLNQMAPFGQGNPEPILALKNISLSQEPRKVGSGDHFQFSVNNGTQNISGIAWNMPENIPSMSEKIDLAFKLKLNSWNGRKALQMVLEDWRVSA